MKAEYIVKRTGRVFDAVISSNGRTVATLSRENSLRLSSAAGEAWTLDPRVRGEIKPFSMRVTLSNGPEEPVLTIMNHVFFHNAKAYMLTGIPEDLHPADHILGRRHVNRMDKFPFSSLEEIDRETWGRLKRYRGVSVGTIDGLGLDGFKVELSSELEAIALPLTAAAYLLYSTA
ncbi:MAG: hypothetical protein KGI38_06245 [Thaumarchaeota archaeon]|nr:hypothetical protein [Nitrososphaerota archaeon]